MNTTSHMLHLSVCVLGLARRLTGYLKISELNPDTDPDTDPDPVFHISKLFKNFSKKGIVCYFCTSIKVNEVD